MNNREKFREAYIVKLKEAIERHPEEYFYGPERVPEVVDKMVLSLATGSANIGPAIKATCRALGIKHTIGAIKEFLTEEGGMQCRFGQRHAIAERANGSTYCVECLKEGV